MIRKVVVRIVGLIFFSLSIPVLSVEPADNPLFSAYPGSKLKRAMTVSDEENLLLEGYLATEKGDNRFPMRKVSGDVTHLRYEVKNVSSLSVFENYKESVVQSGFTIRFECSNDTCGKNHHEHKNFSRAASFFSPSNHFNKPKYLLAEKRGDPSIWVSLYVGHYSSNGATRVLISTVRSHGIALGLVTADLPSYAQIPTNTIRKQKKEDRVNSVDHPLISRYPGSHITGYLQTDYDEISLPIGVPKENPKEFELLNTVGDITRITYSIDGVSTLKIYHNYIAGLTKAGFSTVYSCELEACSSERRVRQALAIMLSVHGQHNYINHVRYQLLKIAQGEQTIYVAVFVGDNKGTAWTHQVVVRAESLQQGLVETNPDRIIDEMRENGRASVYGILFEHDKADIKPKSKQALKLIADVLNKNKDLNIYVVGHTDDSGKASYNLNLSKRRATSVVKSLIADYGIDGARLVAHGAGPYSPAASNRNDLGQQLNRRVELVERRVRQ